MQIFQGGERATDDFLGRVDNPLERFPLCHCAAGEPHTHTVSQDSLYGATIEGHQQFFNEEVIPEYSQEVQSLLCLLDGGRGVDAPGEDLLCVDTQIAEVCHPFHLFSPDEQGPSDCFAFPPEVYDQLLGLGGVQDQVVV